MKKVSTTALAIVALATFGVIFPSTALAGVSVPAVSGLSASASGPSVTLSWVTPTFSDLSEFDIHTDRSPITSSNDSIAPQVSGAPTPVAGATQSVSISGLSVGTHYFSIRVIHVTGTASPISVTSVTVAGGGSVCVQPNPPGNPSVTLAGTSGTLSWLTIGGSPLAEIEIHQSVNPIDDFNFSISPQVSGVPQPLANQVQSVVLSGLKPGTTYNFALRAYNVCGVPSALSTTQVATAGTPQSGNQTNGGGSGPQVTWSPTADATTVSINNGARSTNARVVHLTLGAPGATEMSISNNAAFMGASWEAYATGTSWALTGGSGTKLVFARFRGPNRVFGDSSSSIEFVEFVPVPPASAVPSAVPVAPETSQVAGGGAFRFEISPSLLTVHEGDRVNVVVTAVPTRGVPTTARLELSYPNDALSFESISYGSGWEPSFGEGENFLDDVRGSIVKTARFGGGLRMRETFAVLTFSAKKAATSSVSIVGGSDSLNLQVLGATGTRTYLLASLISPVNGHEENLRAFGITIGIFVMIYAVSLLARLGHRKLTS